MNSALDPQALAGKLKSKKVLLMAGQLCEEIDFGGKTLSDYVIEISNKLNAPIAATGNTPKPLKEKGANNVRKMFAGEIINYMRWKWEDPVIDSKPEVLVFIGYGPSPAQCMASAVTDGETMVLGSTCVEGATYSLPESSSFGQWQKSLDALVKAL